MNCHNRPKLIFAFLLFLSSFISFKSVGTKEMTILHSFLTFLRISQRRRHYEACNSSNTHRRGTIAERVYDHVAVRNI